MALLSVIVPVYNKEAFVGDCIQSILNQTLADLELILVNDGSTDGSYSVCQKYAGRDKRIILIDQANQGVSAARNAGLERATGDYIGFVDSDDTIDNDMYQLLVNNAIENAADISVCRMRLIAGDKITAPAESKEVQILDHSDALIACLKGDLDRSANNKVYKAAIAKSILFTGRMYEDILYTCKVFVQASKTVVQNAPRYNYILRDNSVSLSAFSLKYMETVNVSAQMVAIITAKESVALPFAKAFDVLANISLLNLLLVSGWKSYPAEYSQVTEKLRSYRSFISESPQVKSKHRYAFKIFDFSPALYKNMMYVYCRITKSDVINRT